MWCRSSPGPRLPPTNILPSLLPPPCSTGYIPWLGSIAACMHLLVAPSCFDIHALFACGNLLCLHQNPCKAYLPHASITYISHDKACVFGSWLYTAFVEGSRRHRSLSTHTYYTMQGKGWNIFASIHLKERKYESLTVFV